MSSLRLITESELKREKDSIGSGAFGTVYKVLQVETRPILYAFDDVWTSKS